MREEDLPKHVRKRGKNALQYRRRFEGVKDSKAVFQRAMNSKLPDDASTVQAEAAQKTKVYELELRKRTSAHPDSFTENDIDTLAAELLKQKSKQLSGAIKAGSLYPPQIDTYETALDVRHRTYLLLSQRFNLAHQTRQLLSCHLLQRLSGSDRLY